MAQRVLVGFSTSEGQTAKVAERIAQTLRKSGCEAEVHDVAEIPDLSLAGYDGVVLGASIHMSRHQRRMVEFVQSHREELSSKPCAFFSVSMTAAKPDAEQQRQAEECVHMFEKETGWTPAMFGVFAGALPFTHYGFFTRFIMKRISAQMGGPTDTSRDYEFTQWDSVIHFAEDFLRMLSTSPVQGQQAQLEMRAPAPRSS
jgi:menaquinone-dependent protoporphyrinogen oxidase